MEVTEKERLVVEGVQSGLILVCGCSLAACIRRSPGSCLGLMQENMREFDCISHQTTQ